jgi:hypothetical protein
MARRARQWKSRGKRPLEAEARRPFPLITQPPKPLRNHSDCSEKSSDANRDRKIHCSLISIPRSLNFSA